MQIARLFTLVAMVALMTSSATAQEEAKECAKCPASSSLTSVQQEEGECQECPVMTAALAKLPKMTYKVGEEATCCSKSAATMAEKNSQPVRFVVGDKTFEDKTAAYTALVDSTESFVSEFTTPHKCEKSGKTTLAGQSCDCPVSSAKYAEQVAAAVKTVSMKYKVGEESCGCPNQAAAMAKAGDAKVQYVVGEECTECEMTARISLATAKYKAAVAAINKATGEKSGS